MFIKTLADYSVNLNSLKSYEVEGEFSRPVHWGWWVLWLVVFWPILFLTAIISLLRKKYLVVFYFEDGAVQKEWLDSDNVEKLMESHEPKGNPEHPDWNKPVEERGRWE